MRRLKSTKSDPNPVVFTLKVRLALRRQHLTVGLPCCLLLYVVAVQLTNVDFLHFFTPRNSLLNFSSVIGSEVGFTTTKAWMAHFFKYFRTCLENYTFGFCLLKSFKKTYHKNLIFDHHLTSKSTSRERDPPLNLTFYVCTLT